MSEPTRTAGVPAEPQREPSGAAGTRARPATDHRLSSPRDRIETTTVDPAAPVVDLDPARAALTGRLLASLASQLGFPLARARVRVDPEAARRTGVRGARGLQAGGVIWLHPHRYDPGSATGRSLLAHEATHLAQRALPPHQADRTGLTEAEAEAARAADDFAAGRPLAPPRVALPEGVLAADTGAAAATLPETTGEPPPTVEPGNIAETHAGDITAIRSRLDPGFFGSIDAADVSHILATLDQYPLGLATAIMNEVGTPYRERLASQLGPGHRRRHRRSVLACYAAMTTEEHGRLEPDLLDGMSLRFEPDAAAERAALVALLRTLPEATFLRLLAGEGRGDLLAVMQTPVEPDALEEQRRAAQAAVGQRAQAAQALDRSQLDPLVAALQRLLGSPNAEQGRQALTRLGTLLDHQPSGGAPADEPAATGAPTARPRSPRLAYVVVALEPGGAIDRLIRTLPEADRSEENPAGAVLLEVIRHRPVAANLAHLQRLLSYGFFDFLFRSRSSDAWLAYQIVRRLPPEDQQRWQRLDNGRWFRRLEDNLPRDRITSGQYEGVRVERDEDGQLVDVASRASQILATGAGAQAWRRILDACQAGINSARAPGLLIQIQAVGAPRGTDPAQILPEAQREELRRAVVLRLDQLGYASQIFAALPERFLFELDNLNLVRRIAALRDPEHLRRQVYDLVRRNWWRQVPIISLFVSEWSVGARDAFIAFQLARLLPEADRRELADSGHWAAMIDAMTVEMRHASGTHLYADREGRTGDRLMDRLREDELWRADRAAELRTLVRMAIELGNRRLVFELSRQQRAFAVPQLRPMVDAFSLYAEPERTEYQPERLPATQTPQDLWDVLRNAAGWLWVRLQALSSLRLGLNQVGVEQIDLANLQHITGGDLAGALVAQAPGNHLTLLYHPRDGQLWLHLPELEITSVNRISAGLGVRTNRVRIRGLQAWATFPAQQPNQPAAVRLRLPEAAIEDLLVTGDDLLTGVARLLLRTLDLRLNRTGAEEPVPAPPGSDFRLPIPIIGPLIAFVVNLVQRLEYLGRSQRSIDQLQSLQASVAGIELEGIAYGPDQTAARAEIRDVFAGAGLNRGAYLRALREVLRRRLARATGRGADPVTIADLRQQISDTGAELAAIAGREQRLGELHTRYAADPDGLTDAERQEAAGLEQELAGGTVLDIGAIEVERLAGDVRAERLSLTGLSGAVESPLFTPHSAPSSSVFVSDAERIGQFRAQGPQRPGGTGPAPLQLRAEQASAVGVAYLGAEIPRAAALAQELAALPPSTPELVRDQLSRLHELVSVLERLDAQAAGGALDSAGQRRRQQLRAELRERFATEVDRLDLAGVGADLSIGLPLALDLRQVVAARISATGIRYGGGYEEPDGAGGTRRRGAYEVGSLTATGATGELGALLTQGTQVPGRTEGARGTRFGAADLSLRDIRLGWAGNQLAELSISGLAGEFEPLGASAGASAYRIAPLSAQSATIAGLSYQTSSMRVLALGQTRITGITIDATLRSATEASGLSSRTLLIESLRFDTVEADQLVVESIERADGWRAEITSGLLRGVTLTGYEIVMPAEGESTTSGELGVDALERLRFQVATYATTGAPSLRASGELNTAAGTQARTLEVAMASDGAQDIDLRGLELTRTDVVLPSGRLRIRRGLLRGGRIERAGDTTTIRDFDVPSLEVSRIDWQAGGGQITSTGRTRLRGMTLDASYTSDPETTRRTFRVQRLRIRQITSDDLRYQSGGFELHLRPAQEGTEPLEIRDIRLDGFEWTALGSADGELTAGRLLVGASRADFAGGIRDRLELGGLLTVDSMELSFHRGGRMVARAQGIAGGLTVGVRDERGTQTLDTHLSFAGADTGEIQFRPDAIEVGAPGSPALRIPTLTVDRLNWRGERVAVSVPADRGGVVMLSDATARARIEFHPAPPAGPGGIRRIVLPELQIQQVSADGMRIDFLSGTSVTASLRIPEEAEHERATLGPITLTSAEGATGDDTDGFVIEPDATGEEWSANGGLLLSNAFIPRLVADVSGALSARATVQVDEISLGMFRSGRMTLDLTRPTLRDVRVQVGDDPHHYLVVYGEYFDDTSGLGAEQVSYDSDADPARGIVVTNAYGVGLRYVNRALGVEAMVRRFRLPGQTTVNPETFAGRIPSLEIDLADLSLDIPRLLAEDPAAPPTTPPPFIDRIRSARGVIDSLNGQVSFNLFLPFHPWYIPNQDLAITLNIVDGHLDYENLDRNIRGGQSWLIDFELLDDTLILGINFGSHPDPDFPHGEPPPPAVWSFVRWRLTGEELPRAQERNQVALWRFLQPEPSGGDDDGESTVDTDALRISNLDARLSVRSDRTIPLPLGSYGRLRLAPDAVVGIRATSDTIPGNGQIDLSVSNINVQSANLRLGPVDVDTGAITVTDISGGQLLFTDGEADIFSCIITRATASDIRWQLVGGSGSGSGSSGGGTR